MRDKERLDSAPAHPIFAPHEPLSKTLDTALAAAYLVYICGINQLCPTVWTQNPATLRHKIPARCHACRMYKIFQWVI